MEQNAAVSLLVSGRVQGVGFRWFVARQAKALGISGWVRNLPDGRVEIAASGPKSALLQFESAVAEGPPFANVSRVEKRDIMPEIDQYKSFQIR